METELTALRGDLTDSVETQDERVADIDARLDDVEDNSLASPGRQRPPRRPWRPGPEPESGRPAETRRGTENISTARCSNCDEQVDIALRPNPSVRTATRQCRTCDPTAALSARRRGWWPQHSLNRARPMSDDERDPFEELDSGDEREGDPFERLDAGPDGANDSTDARQPPDDSWTDIESSDEPTDDMSETGPSATDDDDLLSAVDTDESRSVRGTDSTGHFRIAPDSDDPVLGMDERGEDPFGSGVSAFRASRCRPHRRG